MLHDSFVISRNVAGAVRVGWIVYDSTIIIILIIITIGKRKVKPETFIARFQSYKSRDYPPFRIFIDTVHSPTF